MTQALFSAVLVVIAFSGASTAGASPSKADSASLTGLLNLTQLARSQAEAVLEAVDSRRWFDRRRDQICYQVGKLEATLERLSFELARVQSPRSNESGRLSARLVIHSRNIRGFCGFRVSDKGGTAKRGSVKVLREEIDAILKLTPEDKGTVGASGDSGKGTVGFTEDAP